MRKAKDSFQIVPIKLSMGIAYLLKEGNQIHGQFISIQKAEQKKLKIIASRDEIKVIKESANIEFKIEQ